MKVTVCIPTYNAAEFLRECIESVLGQTYKDFEVVVSDNASTDETCEIVRSYSDPRIRLVRLEENKGMAFNFNHAVGLARGDYVKILCADDFIFPGSIEKQADLLDRHPEAVIASAGLNYVDMSSKPLRTLRWFPRETVLSEAEVIARTLIYGNVIGNPSAIMIRRDCLLKAGPFSDRYPLAIDVEMWLRLMDLGPVAFLPESLCGFRLHPHTMTLKFRKEGLIRSDIVRVTEMMLQKVAPSGWARKVIWGRVAGSFLKQTLAGLRHGFVKWPFKALWQALQIDPAFLGLTMHQLLFSPGLVGLQVLDGHLLKVCWGSTLRH